MQRGGVSIVYDGDGNRVQETVAGVTTRYLVGEANPTGYVQVLAELSGTGSVLRGYVWGMQLEAQRDFTVNPNGVFHYYGYDGHGSVRFLTDATGATTDTYDYDAFGNVISQSGTTVNNYMFAGEQFDPALGIYYNRARYYDQKQGRFWTMDTYEGDPESPASLHRYLYSSANPINRRDPCGTEDADAESTLVAGAVQTTIQAVTQLVVTAVRITVVRLLTVSAALGTTILISPGLQEQLEEGGAEAIAAVQKAFFEYEGVVTEAEAEGASIWNSFAQMRQYLNQLYTRMNGMNPSNIEYHHLVEQGQEEASGFAESAINSMANVVPTPSSVHAAISSFYSSAPQWLNGVTVRTWMAAQTWDVQWRAGLEIWKEAMTGAINWHLGL